MNRVSGPVFCVAKGAIGNLTIHGMEDRAGKKLPMLVVKSFPGVWGGSPRGKQWQKSRFRRDSGAAGFEVLPELKFARATFGLV
jgi:hypothetical protein